MKHLQFIIKVYIKLFFTVNTVRDSVLQYVFKNTKIEKNRFLRFTNKSNFFFLLFKYLFIKFLSIYFSFM